MLKYEEFFQREEGQKNYEDTLYKFLNHDSYGK